jgi:hypothetical protein
VWAFEHEQGKQVQASNGDRQTNKKDGGILPVTALNNGPAWSVVLVNKWIIKMERSPFLLS